MEITPPIPHLPVQIDSMKEEDLPEVLAIEQASFRTAWSRDTFLYDILPTPGFFAITAKLTESGEIGGYMIFWDVIHYVHIINFSVREDLRRKGVGAALLSVPINFALDNNIRVLLLEVRESNLDAQRLYSKFGFRQVAVKRGYYQAERENAIIMALKPQELPDPEEVRRIVRHTTTPEVRRRLARMV